MEAWLTDVSSTFLFVAIIILMNCVTKIIYNFHTFNISSLSYIGETNSYSETKIQQFEQQQCI